MKVVYLIMVRQRSLKARVALAEDTARGIQGASWPAARDSRARIIGVSAAIGAILFAIAAYTPWSAGITAKGTELPLNSLAGLPWIWFGTPSVGAFDPVDVANQAVRAVIDYAWCTWTIAGILLSPLLWEYGSSTRARRGPFLFGGWALVTALASCVLAGVALLDLPGTRIAQYGFVRVEPRWGFLLAPVALALMAPVMADVLRMCRSFVPGFRVLVAMTRSFSITASRTRRQRIGIATFTCGALLWSLAFFALPWVSSNCNVPTLSLNYRNLGTCQAMDAAEALGFAVDSFMFPYNKYNVGTVLLALYLLAAFVTCLSLAGIWRPLVRSVGRSWAWMWLGIALVSTVWTGLGAQTVVAVAPARGSVARSWQSDVGLPVACIGLVLAGVGLVLLALGRVRDASAHVAGDDGV